MSGDLVHVDKFVDFAFFDKMSTIVRDSKVPGQHLDNMKIKMREKSYITGDRSVTE
jgi:hypothetical protein